MQIKGTSPSSIGLGRARQLPHQARFGCGDVNGQHSVRIKRAMATVRGLLHERHATSVTDDSSLLGRLALWAIAVARLGWEPLSLIHI
eukprot:668574-Alexandrium_andersonii.AAC.1